MIYILMALLVSAHGEVSIKSLHNSSTTKLDLVLQPNTVAIIFQTNCSACLMQMKDTQCFQGKRVVFLGAFSSERSLRKEIRRLRTNTPAYYAGKKVLQKLNIKAELTPQVLYMGYKSAQLYYGYRPCQEYNKLFAKGRSKNG